MKTIVKFGMATLTVGALLGGTVLSKAETPDTFIPITLRAGKGFRSPDAYFKKKQSQSVTVAVSKAGQGLGDQKTSKAAKKHTRHVHSPRRASSSVDAEAGKGFHGAFTMRAAVAYGANTI